MKIKPQGQAKSL